MTLDKLQAIRGDFVNTNDHGNFGISSSLNHYGYGLGKKSGGKGECLRSTRVSYSISDNKMSVVSIVMRVSEGVLPYLRDDPAFVFVLLAVQIHCIMQTIVQVIINDRSVALSPYFHMR